jgi:hypothetical protein
LIFTTLIASIIAAAGSFAWGYWQAGWETTAKWQVLFGVLWLVSAWKKWRWVSSAAALFGLFFAALGVWFGLHPGWMFAGAAFAMTAYDMVEFQLELRSLPAREDIPGRERRRVLRISILTGLGLFFVSLVIFITGRFTLDWALFLTAIVLTRLLQTVVWAKK